MRIDIKQFILVIILINISFCSFHKHLIEHTADDSESIDSTCASPDLIDGLADRIGVSLNIISFQDKRQIFQFKCKDDQLNLAGTGRIPDGIKYDPLFYMDFQSTVKGADTEDDLENIKLDLLHTQVEYNSDFPESKKQLVAEKDDKFMEIKSKIKDDSEKYLQVSVSYKQRQLSLTDYSKLTLHPELIADLAALPDEYDDRAYGQFIQKWGTHYRESVIVGGRIMQRGFVQPACTMKDQDLQQNFQNYFMSEIQQMNLPENELEDEYLNQNIDNQFSQYAQIEDINIYGGQPLSNDLSGWVDTIQQSPVVVQQKLQSFDYLLKQVQQNPGMIPNMPGGTRTKITQKFPNIGKGNQSVETIRKGCFDKNAINYDKDAIVEDNSLCYYTIFFGSYQEVEGSECPSDDQTENTLLNPITQALSCPDGTKDELIAKYDYDGCTMSQHFCLKLGDSHYQPDLVCTLEICKKEVISQNFVLDNTQYYCDQEETKLLAQFKELDNIWTCEQKFCQKKTLKEENQDGILGFYYQHEGDCNGIEKESDDPFEACKDKCLYQYGTFHVQKDCQLHQYLCLKQQYNNVVCVNEQPPPPKPKPAKSNPTPPPQPPKQPPKKPEEPPEQPPKPKPQPKPSQKPEPTPQPKPTPPPQQPEQPAQPVQAKSGSSTGPILIIVGISLFFILIYVCYQTILLKNDEERFVQEQNINQNQQSQLYTH